MGEDISVGLISWEIIKSRRKPSLFFNDVLLYIWPENILKNRCLAENRTTYKSPDSIVKVLTPRKLSLALCKYKFLFYTIYISIVYFILFIYSINLLAALYNDYLIELNINDGKRIKYLCDSFKIISTKIRDVRKKYNKRRKEDITNERRNEIASDYSE